MTDRGVDVRSHPMATATSIIKEQALVPENRIKKPKRLTVRIIQSLVGNKVRYFSSSWRKYMSAFLRCFALLLSGGRGLIGPFVTSLIYLPLVSYTAAEVKAVEPAYQPSQFGVDALTSQSVEPRPEPV